MYEHFRDELLTELLQFLPTETISRIGNTLDKVAYNYDFKEKMTAVAVIDDEYTKLVKMYLASKHLEGLSDKSIEMYAGRLKKFFSYIPKHPKDIQTNEIRLFMVQYQKDIGISDRSLDKFRQILNGFFEWCVNEEYITKNPCKNIKEIKYEVEPRHSLTRFQLEKVRRACKSERDLAIVDVLYSTGCRVAELVNMKIDDINDQDHSVEIIGKGKKHNTVYLNTNARISLGEYLKAREGDSEYVFVSDRKPHGQLTTRTVQFIFNELAKELGYKLTPHILRHTAATLALQNGMEITQVQKMLGHSSVATTQIYAETSDEEVAISHRKYVI